MSLPQKFLPQASNIIFFLYFFSALCYKALKNGQKELTAALNFSKSVMEERSLMIRVLIAHFSVKIYLDTHFLLSGRLSTLFELRPDPPIQTWLGKKMPSSGHLDKFLKSEGRPGPIQTNWAQRHLDKNPIFGIRPFLLLPGVLVCPNFMLAILPSMVPTQRRLLTAPGAPQPHPPVKVSYCHSYTPYCY